MTLTSPCGSGGVAGRGAVALFFIVKTVLLFETLSWMTIIMKKTNDKTEQGWKNGNALANDRHDELCCLRPA